MNSKIYLAIIFSDYQELNLKRFIDHFNIKDQIIIIKYINNKINTVKFPKNVKIKILSNKYAFSIYFLLVLLKNFSYKIKFIFGNPASKFCTFLRKFVDGKNQIYIDDGFETVLFDFNQLKKDCTVFTIYNIKLPSKIKKIQYFPKYTKKRKKTCNEIFFIGSPLVSNNIVSRDKFMKIMKIISKKNKKFFYYPHRNEIDELSLLPKNFKILKRKFNVEKFLNNYKYNFRLIYSFNSSAIQEILNFYKKEQLRVFDINDWVKKKEESYRYTEDKTQIRVTSAYIKKIKIKVLKLKKK